MVFSGFHCSSESVTRLSLTPTDGKKQLIQKNSPSGCAITPDNAKSITSHSQAFNPSILHTSPIFARASARKFENKEVTKSLPGLFRLRCKVVVGPLDEWEVIQCSLV